VLAQPPLLMTGVAAIITPFWFDAADTFQVSEPERVTTEQTPTYSSFCPELGTVPPVEDLTAVPFHSFTVAAATWVPLSVTLPISR
jgi:hypothetical protein